ncbi:MAG: winged helix-turn-helix transcriptional regulator [Chlorobiota bacterium]|nr:winged helix-turn-helix transcriptional regulator [Chlorobiota bacterium]QQS67035.1 MAG: winged helix-turn-helix transcriptional regulator [Chlorobiota bacterium]
MRIEDEIKQTKPFRSEEQKAGINLMFTSNWYLSKKKKFFEKYNITSQQYNVLRILKGVYPSVVSTCVIMDRMIDKYSDASRIVERLFTKKLIDKNVNLNDKRLVDVKINSIGILLIVTIEKDINQLDNFMSSLNQEELILLNKLLDKLRN